MVNTGGFTGEDCHIFFCTWGLEGSVHFFNVGHRLTHHFFRHLQPELIPGLQKDAVSLHQPMPHSAVCGLPEVTAFRMLDVGTAGEQCDFHIRYHRTRQHSSVIFFFQMGDYQPLPVPIQNILAAVRIKLKTASPFPRFQQQMDLCIMAEGVQNVPRLPPYP